MQQSLAIPVWGYDEESISYIGKSFAQNDFIAGSEVLGNNHEVLYRFKNMEEKEVIQQKANITYQDKIIGEVNISVTTCPLKERDQDLLITVLSTLGGILMILILVTGLVIRSIPQKRCLAAGMDGYIPKPVEPQKVQAIISEWIELMDQSTVFISMAYTRNTLHRLASCRSSLDC